MSEFANEVNERAAAARRSLAEAEIAGDEYLVRIRIGELEELARLAADHDLELPGVREDVARHQQHPVIPAQVNLLNTVPPEEKPEVQPEVRGKVDPRAQQGLTSRAAREQRRRGMPEVPKQGQVLGVGIGVQTGQQLGQQGH